MKTLYTVICLTWACCNAFGQTITNSVVPDIGSITNHQQLDTAGIHEGPAGINQIWDFSAAVHDLASVDLTGSVPSSVPDDSLFPNATVALCGVQTCQLIQKTSTQSLYWGNVFQQGVGTVLSDPQVTGIFPASVGTTNTDTWAGISYNHTSTSHLKGTITFTVDASGTLITPTGHIENVMRFKTVIDYSDSFSFLYPPTLYHNVIYDWMLEGHANPVFEIFYDTTRGYYLDSSAYTSAHKFINYDPTVLSGINEVNTNINVSIFPNPSHGIVQVNVDALNDERATLSIVNVAGQTVLNIGEKKLTQGKNQLQVNTTSLAAGQYLLRINGAKGSITLPLIVE